MTGWRPAELFDEMAKELTYSPYGTGRKKGYSRTSPRRRQSYSGVEADRMRENNLKPRRYLV
ncbi:MAG: hypothetical protein OXF02_06360 [Simkaniaceae bacterium]|nr:hypothetical protein [Simkaniaceae bacterium]